MLTRCCGHIRFTAHQHVCLCVHIRSVGADWCDVISPALMNTLICLTASLHWRGEDHGCDRTLVQNMTFAYNIPCVYAAICKVYGGSMPGTSQPTD